MTIKEVEKQTGLPRSVIRFYEKEGLIVPQRNEDNRYRAYTQEDVDRLIRIAFLRTMDISIEAIRRVIAGEISLAEAADAQIQTLREKEKDVARAMRICARLQRDAPEHFDDLDVSLFTGETKTYVAQYRSVLLQDCERFALWFGKDDCWMALTIAGTLLASIVFPKLPEQIPVQWSEGVVTGSAPRGMIFAYPLLMLVVRLVFGGRIRALCRLHLGGMGERIAPYAVNGLCFLFLCLEAFTVLYLFGVMNSVEAAILFAGIFVLVLARVALYGFGTKDK